MSLLAPFFFRNLEHHSSKVFEKIHVSQEEIFGARFYHASAKLNSPGAFLQDVPILKNEVYGNFHSSGSSAKKPIAVYKAISEGLERLAYYQCVNSNNYGFDVDPTTNGMAAFPEFFYLNSKKNAKSEAAERFVLIALNEGSVDIRRIDSSGIKLKLEKDIDFYMVEHPILSASTFILSHYYDQEEAIHCYGFCNSHSLDAAFERSIVELYRNWTVLRARKKRHDNAPESIWEKRLVFFSTQSGWNTFKKLVSKPRMSRPDIPKINFNGPVIGPWTKWAKVWRHSYKLPSKRYLTGDEDYFFF